MRSESHGLKPTKEEAAKQNGRWEIYIYETNKENTLKWKMKKN